MSKFFKTSSMLLAVICTVVLLSSMAFAVPAYQAHQTFAQPGGATFSGTLQGDEWLNWVTTDDGDVVVKNSEDKTWRYAEIQNGNLVATDKKVKLDAKPSKTVKHSEAATIQKAAAAKAAGGASGITATSGTQPMLVMIVDFTDISCIYTDAQFKDSFFNGVNAYYNEVSHGKFQFSPATETQGTANDGIIHVKLNYAHPNNGGNIDSRNQKIVKDALTAADSYINFASFDKNSNGALARTELHIALIIAGYEAAYDNSTPSVWAHSWACSGSYAITLDSKKICNSSYAGGYTMEGERHSTHMCTIGTLAHELGHDISLPDLYDTTYASDGVGIHSLMAGGSWAYSTGYPGSSPTHMDAYCKVGLGWITPISVPTGTNTYSMSAASTSADNVLKVPTSLSSEYFLVENRQFTGYDAGLDTDSVSGGILILHVDTTKTNNDTVSRKMVDVEEANQGTLGYSQLDTSQGYGSYDHNYRVGGAASTFSNTTTPNSKLNSGTATNITISTSSSSGNPMSVTVTK